MDKLRINSTKAAQPHYLYDLSLPLPDRMHKRMPFPSAIAIAAFLGVAPQRIYESRSKRYKIWSEAQHGWFTVRIANPKTICS